LIPENVPCPFLVEIGVMTAAGKVRADKQHKFRQINRFLEFVDDVLPQLPSEGTLHVVDFGCGKSSLTFAVHHLLTAVRGRDVRIVGLDRNPHVIRECRRIAAKLGSAGLEFHEGDIASHDATERVHLAISLHACDTATDAALAKAISWKADAILAVPCCQHELAPVLESESLAPLLRHGILRERLATLVTDALRAELLEANGYRTQVLEFIDLEHTPKNLLIRAVRRETATDDRAAHTELVERMKSSLGIASFALERQ
jgi:SAM-dependent methyltransferase